MILLPLVKVCEVYQQLLTQMNLGYCCFSTEALRDQWGHSEDENYLHSLQKHRRGPQWLSDLLHVPSWKASCQYWCWWDVTWWDTSDLRGEQLHAPDDLYWTAHSPGYSQAWEERMSEGEKKLTQNKFEERMSSTDRWYSPFRKSRLSPPSISC